MSTAGRRGDRPRVPFDEGSLTGALRRQSQWPDGDWRNIYFAEPHLSATLRRVELLHAVAVQSGTTLPDLALRFNLAHHAVTTTIPGMRRVTHVDTNMTAGKAPPLDAAVIQSLRAHRWDRVPDDRP